MRKIGRLILIVGLLLGLASPLIPDGQAASSRSERWSQSVLPAWFSLAEVPGFPLPSEVLTKIEPALLKQLLREKTPRLRFIVHLTEQAQLADEAKEANVQARRRQIVAALQATAARTQAGIRAFLAQEQAVGRAADVRPFWIFNGLAVTGERETAFALAARPEVAFLRLDHRRHLPDSDAMSPVVQSAGIEWNVARIGAPLVWDALGLDGSGVVVANLDSGVDWLHPALQSRYRGYDPHGVAHQHNGNWFDATDQGALYPVDGNGHGTHTMGTILGGEGIGVAPGARWIAARAFDSTGVGYDSWIHAAFEWLLAPNGDLALAPDVINNSWGNTNGSSEVFRDDVRALRAAGIHAVFSAGNSGPNSGTVGSPGSYPESLAVGATDADDEIAYFSSRGPSPWGEVKPEISAPGVDVRSALPGGAYGTKQGTSMAAPHVAGVLALMLQAKADLNLTDAEQALVDTAVTLPSADAVPNNDYGWGRVDAYAAAMAVAARGILSGTVRADDNAPIPGATVAASPTEGGPSIQTTADAQGRYALGLQSGPWDLTALAFGHAPQTANRVEIVTGATTIQNFSLTPLPAGTLTGTVTEAGSGLPLSATLTVEGTPARTTTDPANGAFSLSLPTGVYTLSTQSHGHRVGWAANVPITVGQSTIRHFSLITAPTVLLVDSGAWYYGSEISFYQQALDALNYLYETLTVKILPGEVPTISDLAPYDIVIWSAPFDAPGYVGASDAISGYLRDGGNLLVSGQDVAFWDGGGSGLSFADYFLDVLYARYLADNAATRQVQGKADDLFGDIALSVEGGDGADNQSHPDVIAARDPEYATSVLTYQDDDSAGQRVGLCLPYRALYLAFGFEGIDNAVDRQEIMDRSLDWFASPRQKRGVELTSQTFASQIAPAGATVTHVLHLRNTGETQPQDTFDITVTSTRGWSYTLSNDSFTLLSCQRNSLTLTVQIPSTASWDTTETMTLTARSRSDPEIVATAVLTSKTPAPILLVDDDRWFDQEDRYTAALQASGYRHDVWDVQLHSTSWTGPSAEILGQYPIVLWYTAYDWFSPLTTDEESHLIDYLDGGGRLFFSSQDYLFNNGLTDLGRDYFGLADYTEDLTSTTATGVNGNTVGDRLGPFALDFSFRNWSDALEPIQAQDAAFAGQHGLPIGLSHAEADHKAIFFSFPLETLDPAARVAATERIVGWLSWLGTSTFEADATLAGNGETLTYTLTLRNDGSNDLARVAVTNTLPISLSLVPGSLTPVEATHNGSDVHWQGPLAQGAEVVVRYRAELAPALPAAEVIANPARIQITDQHLTFTRTARTRVNAPDLGASGYSADRETARPGETLTYTLVLRNDGLIDAPSASLTNPVPINTSLVSDSLLLESNGLAAETNGVITWQGDLLVGQPVTLNYQAVITDYAGYNIWGRVWLNDGYGERWEQTARTAVPLFETILPLIFKNGTANQEAQRQP